MAFRDIRKQRKWLSAEEIRFLVIGLLVLGLALAANISLAQILPGGEWFFQRWSGARSFLLAEIGGPGGVKGERLQPEGEPQIFNYAAGPYSTEIAQRTQEVVYGRRAFSSEYTYVLNDPLFILMLYSPLALVSNYTLAHGIWMLLCEAALIASVFLAINLSEWEPRPWLYVLLAVFGLVQFFSLNGLVSGSPTVLLTFLYLCILLALRSGADELVGALLALVAYQWEVGGLFFIFILFFALQNRRWGVLAGLGMALFVLLVISFLIDPDWGLPYLRAVLSAWYRGVSLNLGAILAKWIPDLRFPAGRVVAIALGFLLFLEWFDAVEAHFRRVVWTAALSLAATPLMGFPIFPSNHVVLILPFLLIVALAWERWPRSRVIRVGLLLLLVLLVPYGMYYRVLSVYDPLVIDLISILPPVAAILGLYWMRWWALRSPRPWLDRLGERA